MITKVWFHRTTENKPAISLFSSDSIGESVLTSEVSEEVYDNWVPDTNHFPGENIKEGVIYDKKSQRHM